MKQAKRTRIANRVKTLFPRFILTRKSCVEWAENFTSLLMLVPNNVQPVRYVKFNREGVRIVSLQFSIP